MRGTKGDIALCLGGGGGRNEQDVKVLPPHKGKFQHISLQHPLAGSGQLPGILVSKHPRRTTGLKTVVLRTKHVFPYFLIGDELYSV